MRTRTILYATLIVTALCSGCYAVINSQDSEPVTATFSIVAYDVETREWGVAVASKVLAVGYIVPWAQAGVGAVATQAMVNVSFGPEGVALLEEGHSAEDALDELLSADEGCEERQIGIVDVNGIPAAFTGTETLAWSGHVIGDHYTVQGNILTGEDVLVEMERAYVDTEGPLARRLVEALKAGEAAGGDSRGKESAAVFVVKENGGYQGVDDRLVDIRVDDHAEPVAELARIYDMWEVHFVLPIYLDSNGVKEQEYVYGIVERAIGEGGDNAELHNAMAWELAVRKLYPDEALEMALRANELAPDDPNIMDTVAEAYYAAGEYGNAVEWERKALAIDPENAFFNEQLGKFEEALAGR
ncbi:MAG: DUF1028 domain-containing protein [Candidatus Coatesbacteria bacterium]|nr:MAG: DUF1028 domain-containing protein [Candidatus Coatesbacteria bacterium]